MSVHAVKANASAKEGAKLRDDEIIPQMRWVFLSSFSKQTDNCRLYQIDHVCSPRNHRNHCKRKKLVIPGISNQPKQIAWGLYELAKHPEVQARLREEIIETRMKIQARGETEFTTNDLDTMPYLVAVMKVWLIGSKHPVTR